MNESHESADDPLLTMRSDAQLSGHDSWLTLCVVLISPLSPLLSALLWLLGSGWSLTGPLGDDPAFVFL